MALDLMRKQAFFVARAGGPQSTVLTFDFPTNVRLADAAINGFEIGFTNGDHHLLRTRIDIEPVSINLNQVQVKVVFSIRDASGNFDDPYNGFVDVLMIVDRI